MRSCLMKQGFIVFVARNCAILVFGMYNVINFCK